jgi:hypothetical protein
MAKIHIARNGKIIGEHDEHAVTALVALRQILPTDHWWKKGMARWLPIGSTFNPPETRRPKPDNHLRYTCERCGTRFNEPVEQKSGNVLTELFYWICSPIAGGFYTAGRALSAQKHCPNCASQQLRDEPW